MRFTCSLFIVGMIMGSGTAVFAGTPQSGKYCTSGRGYGELMFLAKPKPDGGLDFGLLLSTTEGNVFSVAGTARRAGSGWRYEADMNAADPDQRCAIKSIAPRAEPIIFPRSKERAATAMAGIMRLLTR
jgi:hypothetical protein